MVVIKLGGISSNNAVAGGAAAGASLLIDGRGGSGVE